MKYQFSLIIACINWMGSIVCNVVSQPGRSNLSSTNDIHAELLWSFMQKKTWAFLEVFYNQILYFSKLSCYLQRFWVCSFFLFSRFHLVISIHIIYVLKKFFTKYILVSVWFFNHSIFFLLTNLILDVLHVQWAVPFHRFCCMFSVKLSVEWKNWRMEKGNL